MMKNKFTIGAIAGMSSVALAVPLLVQLSSAQTSSSTNAETAGVTDQQVDTSIDTHVGANGVREEILTGDSAAKATAAALAAVPGGTIDRVETDAEGDVYEAHMTAADGSHVTVKFDANFNVTKIETGGGHKGR